MSDIFVFIYSLPIYQGSGSMTLQQLHYIVELSKHNSISAAAQALFIAQPSLSTAVKELEKSWKKNFTLPFWNGTATASALRRKGWNSSIMPIISSSRRRACVNISVLSRKERKSCACPFLPSIICLPSMPSPIICNRLYGIPGTPSPSVKAVRPRSFRTSSPSAARSASSLFPR